MEEFHKRKVSLNTSTYLKKKIQKTFSCVENLVQGRKELSNSRVMQVLLIFF